MPRVQATLGRGLAWASQWVLQTCAWHLSGASGGAHFPSVRRGKFHMALAWDRARPCLSGQKEGAMCIPPGGNHSPPRASRVLLTFPSV